jgi:hypothetical protein
MARKTAIVVVDQDGRDKGKRYLLTEMPASRAEKWAARAFLALAHSGVEVPQNLVDAGFAGIAILGLRSLMGLQYDEAEPLLDEMMTCVEFLPDPTSDAVKRPINESAEDIEEVTTRVQLRTEVFQLHVGFSLAGALRTSPPASATTSPDSSNAQTSQETSQQSLPPVGPV